MPEATWSWEIAERAMPVLLGSIGLTALTTLAGILLAIVFGVFLSAVELSRSDLAAGVSKAFKSLICSTPLLLHVFILFYVLPQFGVRLSPFATACVAFMVYFGSVVSNSFTAAVNAIPRPILESCAVLNLSDFQAWRSVIAPLAFRASIPTILNYTIMCWKETAVLVVIGLPILLGTAEKFGYENFRYLEAYTLTAIIYTAVTVPLSILVRRIESRHVFE